MNPYEKIKELAREKGISIRELEKDLGLSNGYFSKWKKVSPNSDGLQKVADYFNVSTDYLLGRTDDPHLGIKNEEKKLTVQQALASVMSSDGKPITENDQKILTDLIEGYLEKKYK